MNIKNERHFQTQIIHIIYANYSKKNYMLFCLDKNQTGLLDRDLQYNSHNLKPKIPSGPLTLALGVK